VHCENDKPIANMERNLRVKASRALPRHRDVAPIPNIDAVEDRLSGPANAVMRMLLCEGCMSASTKKQGFSFGESGGALRRCVAKLWYGRYLQVVALPALALERFTPSQLTFAISRLSTKERPTTVELRYPSSTRPCE
jgi:hypothetical protein